MGKPILGIISSLALTTAFASANPDLDPQDIEVQVAELLQPLLDQDLTSGAVLIAHGEEILLARGFGSSNRDHNIGNSTETRFRLASTSKALTAVAVMQLVERGAIDLDAQLATYLPDYPRAKEIQIQHLLTHSSGIPSTPFVEGFLDKSLASHTLEESITWFKDEPLHFDPGTQFDYSNSGYILLSRVIELASGIAYENYMEDYVFAPTQMTGSGLDSQGRIVEGRSTGYSRNAGGEVVRAAYRNPTECFGCGALFSTVGDLFKFQRAIVNAQLLSSKTRDTMWTPVFATPWGDDYGLGWFVGDRFGHKMVAARGGTTGFMSTMQYYPDADILVVILLNQDFMLHAELFDRLAAIALGEPWKALLLAPHQVEQYHPLLAFVGDYRMDDGVIVTISAGENDLFYEEEGQPQRFRIHPVDDHVGYVAEPNARLIFRAATNEGPAELVGLFGVLYWRGERVSNGTSTDAH